MVFATTASLKHCLLNLLVFIIFFPETVISLLIDTPDLNKEQLEDVHTMFSRLVETYVEGRDHPTDKPKGLRALTEFIAKIYKAFTTHAYVGSLIMILNCQTIEGLEHLWSDYLSGHLDKVAERYLLTDEMKKRLNLETINLKTIIKEEHYLKCREVLMERSGVLCSVEYKQMPFWANMVFVEEQVNYAV